MPGVQYQHMSRADLERAVVGLAGYTWPHDIGAVAVRAILQYNELQTTPLNVTQFFSSVNTLASYLDVPMPAVPDDLSELDDAALVALAQSLDHASWDFSMRSNALDYTQQFYRKQVAGGGAVPSLGNYRDTFLQAANIIRERRGLTDLTA